jgi:DDE superfamily endonuclease
VKPWLKEQWCIPTVSAEYVWRMEDVLDLYAAPDEPLRPQVCFDELPYQLVSEVRTPLPAAPGQVERYDYEYHREGTCNLFVVFAPQRGWRHAAVTERRTAVDFAGQMKWLVDEAFPEAEVIRVVLDNLSTHTPAALYEAYEAAEARRIVEKLEFHYTPKHGSWLNMVEIELGVLSRQCLERRLGSIERVRQEVAAWEQQRNAARARVNWRFKITDARIKLSHLYPS